jgi:hypothetical protein
MPLDG